MSEDTTTKNNIQPISLPGGHGFKLGIDKANNELYWGHVSGTDYTLIAGGEKDPTVQSWARITYNGTIPLSALPTIIELGVEANQAYPGISGEQNRIDIENLISDINNLVSSIISGNISDSHISDDYLATNLAIVNYVTGYVSGYVADQLVEAGAHTHANKDLLDNISTYIDDKVDKVDGKGLSTNDFTDAEKTKLKGIAPSAQVNIIESITVNGNNVDIENKTANIDIPVNSGFTLAGLSEKSYNSLTDKPTLSGNVIAGSIDNNLTEFVKHIIPVEDSIIDNDVNSTNVPNINAVTGYVNDRITQLNNFDGNYNSLTNLPTINNNIISGEISGNIKSVISENVSISKETTTSGTTLSWTIDDKTDSINIEKEKWLSDVDYDNTKGKEQIIFTVTNGNTFNIPVTEFINEYTSKDFKLNDLDEKSYNSLTEKPTINGRAISGEISELINGVIPIATNNTVGLVKGSNSVQIDDKGTMTVIADGIVMENANHANIADIAKATSGTLTIFGKSFNGSENVSISAEIFGTKPDTNNYLSGSTVYGDLSALDTTIKTLTDKVTNFSISADTNTTKDTLSWSIDGKSGSLDINKYSAGSGLTLNNDNSFNITKDTNNIDSKFLVINDDTIGLSGITDAITGATVASANKLTNKRDITLSGVISGSAEFDGSNNITINTVLDNVTIDPSMIDGLTLKWDDVTEKPIFNGELINAPLSSLSDITTVSSVTNYVSSQVSGKVDKEDGKGLSTNDFTTDEKTKLEGIEAGAEVNVINAITVNGNNVDIKNKTANITIDIPELPTIETTLTETSTNDTVAGSKAVVDYVSAYVSGKIEDLNNFDGNYNSLSNLPAINGNKITGTIDETLTEFVKNIDGFGGEDNVIEAITVNGVSSGVTITDKTANIEIPSEILYYNGTNERPGQLIISGTTGSNVDGGYVKLESGDTTIDLSLPIIDDLISDYEESILSGTVPDSRAVKKYVKKYVEDNASTGGTIKLYNEIIEPGNEPSGIIDKAPSVNTMIQYVSGMIAESYGELSAKLIEILS